VLRLRVQRRRRNPVRGQPEAYIHPEAGGNAHSDARSRRNRDADVESQPYRERSTGWRADDRDVPDLSIG
jgi:hypothetical protein